MARNLCKSKCCNTVVRLSDLRGKPIEFRRFRHEPSVIGTKWLCPECHTAYFVIWRDAIYGYRGFVLDLSYYESFNDEPGSPEEMNNPRHLCFDDATEVQEVW